MNHVTPLIRTPAIVLERFEHDAHVAHRDPDCECATTHAVNFVERGSFRIRSAGANRWTDLTSRHVLVTMPGLEFSCAHDADYPDDQCLSTRYTDLAIESLRGQGVHVASAPVVALTNRRAYLRQQLATTSTSDVARVEAIAGELYWSLTTATRGGPLFRPEQLSWYATRVDRVKALIDARFAEPLSLSAMANDASMSVYHFARVFNELEGQTPHRRLIDVRLRHARRRLLDGAGVTETCFAVGFGSLSHFISSYRKHFGHAPSQTRG